MLQHSEMEMPGEDINIHKVMLKKCRTLTPVGHWKFWDAPLKGNANPYFIPYRTNKTY